MKEIEIIKSRQGYKMIKLKAVDVVSKLGGFGICDMCNESSLDGFYIGVLNRWYCVECKEDFEKNTQFYKEDLDFEEKSITRIINILNNYEQRNNHI